MMGACTKCGQHGYVMPLHDERGGPLFCFMCAGAWHAEHAPRRRRARRHQGVAKSTRRRAADLYGRDFDELKLAANGMFIVHEADDVGDDFTRSDVGIAGRHHRADAPRQAPGRAQGGSESRHAGTACAQAVRVPGTAPSRSRQQSRMTLVQVATRRDLTSRPSPPPAYPCEDCCDVIPMDYCDRCRAQYDKKREEDNEREEKERQRKNERQRERYEVRREHWLARQRPTACATCGEKFEPKRSDAKYCSAACRQRAYVKRDGKVIQQQTVADRTTSNARSRLRSPPSRTAPSPPMICASVSIVWNGSRSSGSTARPSPDRQESVRATLRLYLGLASTFIFQWLVVLESPQPHLDRQGALVGRERCNSEKKRKAAISPGGDRHNEVVEGGGWWNDWQKDVAEFKKRRAA